MPDIIEPLTPSAFAEALHQAIAPWRFEDTRLHAQLSRSHVRASLLRGFAGSTYLLAANFLGVLATLADQSLDPEARLLLIENLLEEEGIVLKPSRGFIIRPEQRHVALAARFLHACGCDPEALGDVGTTALSTAGGMELLAQGRWLDAVAFILIGNELKSGAASAVIVERLRSIGFAERDIAYFQVHIEADKDHGNQAIAILTRLATSREQQDSAILAAQAGARAWFSSYGGAVVNRRPAIAA